MSSCSSARGELRNLVEVRLAILTLGSEDRCLIAVQRERPSIRLDVPAQQIKIRLGRLRFIKPA